jgi:hypothetical protein
VNALERQLAAARTRPDLLANAGRVEEARVDENRVHENRLAMNLEMVHAELDAPSPPLLARVLRRLGVSDLNVPLITATPALRRSWLAAMVVALLFALNAASGSATGDVDRIVVFLTIAPLIPLMGVALAFGRGVDPTHDLVVAAPRDTFAVFLIRVVTVVATSVAVLAFSSLLLRSGGLYRAAWLLPSLAVTSATMALGTRLEPRRAAALVATAWIGFVVLVSQALDPASAFGWTTQAGAVLVAVACGAVVLQRRGQLDSGATP